MIVDAEGSMVEELEPTGSDWVGMQGAGCSQGFISTGVQGREWVMWRVAMIGSSGGQCSEGIEHKNCQIVARARWRTVDKHQHGQGARGE